MDKIIEKANKIEFSDVWPKQKQIPKMKKNKQNNNSSVFVRSNNYN